MSEAQPPDPRPGYETHDLRLKGLIAFAVILLLVTALALWLMWRTLGVFRDRSARSQEPLPLASERRPAPRPPLEADHLRMLHTEEDRILGSYGWVDEQMGVARIPIERAIDMLAERGLPARGAPQAGRNEDGTGSATGEG